MHRVPAELGFRDKKLQYLEQSIAHWVMAHSALAFMLPTLVEHGEVERRAIRVSDYVRELDELAHAVAFEPGASLRTIYGGLDGGLVTSIHHQAVRELGKDLAVEARAVPDGIVEAIRWRGDGFVLGVQWHPEFHPPTDTRLLPREPLLEAFLSAVAARKERG
ncbi:MAG: hypothetical protein A3H93_01155 [Rhodocyclales bacterium RIFCSPLOWO2_02_FULL_63_24]|nr:MAG: hypothetical protein A3H93_01155 [Rhodocyclales bacterium RIFCSPLOWO2_02_FULL_63_24]